MSVKYYAIAAVHIFIGRNVYYALRQDAEGGVTELFSKEKKEWEPLPEHFSFNAENETFIDERTGTRCPISYVVIPSSADQWEAIVYDIKLGWKADQFGDFYNDHYQVGGSIRFNCLSGKWDVQDRLKTRTDSFPTVYAAFQNWEMLVSKAFPHYDLTKIAKGC